MKKPSERDVQQVMSQLVQSSFDLLYLVLIPASLPSAVEWQLRQDKLVFLFLTKIFLFIVIISLFDHGSASECHLLFAIFEVRMTYFLNKDEKETDSRPDI